METVSATDTNFFAFKQAIAAAGFTPDWENIFFAVKNELNIHIRDFCDAMGWKKEVEQKNNRTWEVWRGESIEISFNQDRNEFFTIRPIK